MKVSKWNRGFEACGWVGFIEGKRSEASRLLSKDMVTVDVVELARFFHRGKGPLEVVSMARYRMNDIVGAGYPVKQPFDKDVYLVHRLQAADRRYMWRRFRSVLAEHGPACVKRFWYYPYLLNFRRSKRLLMWPVGRVFYELSIQRRAWSRLRTLWRTSKLKRELMERACHPSRLSQIGL